ncbi:metallophosphoesterase [Myxococcota bacterium]|nr:metallophosphoesterase [Myxococcota bacterium]
MRTLFVGDVHGCAAELDLLLERARPDRLVMVGDLFTKGPDAPGVWALLQAWRAEAVLGNHDDLLLRKPEKAAGLGLPPAALDWVRALPLSLSGSGPLGPWLVIHAGVHPERGLAGTSRDQALVMRRFPDDSTADHPYWWQRWAGPPLVIYGHDAVRGLQDHRPHSLGLDTGCVYGGALTGFVLETGEILSVPARRAWRPVEGPPPGRV